MHAVTQFAMNAWAFVGSGLGVFHPADNPRLYPSFVVLLLYVTLFKVFARIKDCVDLCRDYADDSIGTFVALLVKSSWRFALVGLAAYVPVLLYWWTVSTPPDRLPFLTQTALHQALAGADTEGLYAGISYVIHVLALYFVLQFLDAWIVQPVANHLLESYVRARRPSDIQVLSFGGRLGGLKLTLWSSAFVVCMIASSWSPVTVAFAWTFLGASTTSFLLNMILGVSLEDLLRGSSRRVRFASLMISCIYTLAFAFVWLVYNSDRSNLYLLVFALFAFWTLVDGALGALVRVIDSSTDTFYSKLSPVRVGFTVPIIVLMTFLCADNTFPSLDIMPSVWLIAGAGGAVYAIFAPLIDTVRKAESTRYGVHIETTIFRRSLEKVIGRALKIGVRIGAWVVAFMIAPFEDESDDVRAGEQGRTIDSSGNEITDIAEFNEFDSGAGAVTDVVEEANQAINTLTGALSDMFEKGRLAGRTAPAAGASETNVKGADAAMSRFQALGFPTYMVFLISVLIYYAQYRNQIYLPVALNLSRLGPVNLSGGTVTVILSVLNFLLGLGFPKLVKYFSGFLVLVSFLVFALLSNVSSQLALQGVAANRLGEFLDVCVVLLIVGHVAYLLKVLFLLIRRDIRTPDEEPRIGLGQKLGRRKRWSL